MAVYVQICMFFVLVKVTYVDETPPSVDATFNKGFSATGTVNAQTTVNSGVNGQSSIARTYNAQSPLGSVDSQSTFYTNVETAPQQVHVQKFKKRLHHHHHLWPNHSKVSMREQRVYIYVFTYAKQNNFDRIIKTNTNFVE